MDEDIRILIADDHPIFRAGIRQVLEKERHLRIVGECADGEEALRSIMDLHPDVAVLDFQMPRMTALDVVRRLAATGVETRVVLLTMVDDRKIFLEAMDLGVSGYVLKDSAVTEIVQAVKSVVDERPFISPVLTRFLLEKRANSGAPPPAIHLLTPTEARILKLIGELKSNREIAEHLFISKRTVENHRVHIARKLNLSGSHALLKFALENRSEP